MKQLKRVILLFIVLALFSSTAISVSAQSAGSKELTANTTVSFTNEASFKILIKNDDSKAHSYKLKYESSENGVQAYFALDGKITTEVEVKALDSAIMDFKVKMPDTSQAGAAIINTQAIRDDGQVFNLPVSVTVNHDYSMLITSRLNGLSAITGQDVSFDVSVTNNGRKNLDNIKLSLDLPYKWILKDTNPQRLSLKPGENGSYKVKISIPPSQVSGNSTIKVSAVSDNTVSPKVEIPVSVQNNPNYLIWVIGILVLAGAGTLIYFRKYGRR